MLNLFQHLSNITPPQSSPSREEEQFRKYKCGFTLAETLITLIIIGVIAAITIPSLIAKYHKEQTVTRLKKAYSTLSQTTQKAIADNGPMSTWKYVSGSDKSNLKFAQTYLFPYLNIINNCINNTGNIINSGTCSFNYYYLNPTSSEQSLGNDNPRFVLSDGTLLGFYCSHNSYDGDYCKFYIDVNGKNKPNRIGKDIFIYLYFIIPGTGEGPNKNKGKFVPFGITNSREYLLSHNAHGCNKNVSTTEAGEYCTTLIMKDSWQIKDDYPW